MSVELTMERASLERESSKRSGGVFFTLTPRPLSADALQTRETRLAPNICNCYGEDGPDARNIFV